MPKHPPPLGEQIRDARMAARLTQEQLAVRAGVAVSTVRRIEQGEPITVGRLTAIAAVLDLRLELTP